MKRPIDPIPSVGEVCEIPRHVMPLREPPIMATLHSIGIVASNLFTVDSSVNAPAMYRDGAHTPRSNKLQEQ